MQPEAQTTTRGSHTVSAGALEVKGSFKALKEMLTVVRFGQLSKGYRGPHKIVSLQLC